MISACLILSGLFCAHLIKAFTYLQIENIPSKYIMKRYTRDARMMVTWDRHDIANMGIDCEDERYVTRKLVDLAMMAVRALRKTSIGVERGSKDLQALAEWVKALVWFW